MLARLFVAFGVDGVRRPSRWELSSSVATILVVAVTCLLYPRDGCEVLRAACMYVCTLAYLKTHVQTARHILYMLPAAVARSSSDNSAIRYVFPVLWVTPCVHIMGQNQRRRYVRWCSPGSGTSRQPRRAALLITRAKSAVLNFVVVVIVIVVFLVTI